MEHNQVHVNFINTSFTVYLKYFVKTFQHLDKRMYPTYSHFPYVGPCMYQYPIYYSAPGPFMRGNYVTPPMYSTPHVSMVVKPEPPSCSWTTESSTESDSKNDNIAGETGRV